jgi:hypothetical protein
MDVEYHVLKQELNRLQELAKAEFEQARRLENRLKEIEFVVFQTDDTTNTKFYKALQIHLDSHAQECKTRCLSNET